MGGDVVSAYIVCTRCAEFLHTRAANGGRCERCGREILAPALTVSGVLGAVALVAVLILASGITALAH